mmetsp:Transcript_29820/g.98916  ORF Transcript_29820/g.98916 Transcript_29820/m.98916 type:complete len:94 (-) Transcript_29820:248-529(-)
MSTSGDLHYARCNETLLELTAHYCRRNTADEQTLDILHRSVVGDFLDLHPEDVSSMHADFADRNSGRLDKDNNWNHDNGSDTHIFGMQTSSGA